MIGGLDLGGGATTTIFFSGPNATGSISSWATTTPVPSARYYHTAVEDTGTFYVVGGNDSGGSRTSTVFFAPVGGNGVLGEWSLTAALPAALESHGSAVHNGYLYTTGGFEASGIVSTVRYTPLASRNTYWGVTVPGGQASGDYTSTITFTSVFEP